MGHDRSASFVLIVVVLLVATMVEVKQIKEITNRWHIAWDIRIVDVLLWVRQIVAAAASQRVQVPVPLDEFHEGGDC